MLDSYENMIAFGLVVLPLIVIAWAAVVHVSMAMETHRYERYKRFHAIMEQLARSDGATADKMAAAYELRNYREFKDVIARIFADGKVRDLKAEALQKQLKDTLDHVGH